ncbi:EspG family protein [Haloechinothrix alba]|uniref:EspG family protein n=1 Tax=Haloechinothrix alba TaxID=664784 RepID=A0A238VPP2_9PSEU|nr:ESX secretion-associated protein EspG [Haloechinothrix alba]SNR36107.1 EspG family protein [Haloechinothrix alba]
MITRPVTISLETYSTLLDKENLGEAHTTLLGGVMWYPPDAARERDVRVLGELREQGLVDGTRVSEAFYDTLVTMQRPTVEYYTYFGEPGTERRSVRSAVLGREAVLVHADNRRIDIEPIPGEQLGVRLVSALPDTPAAQTKSINCDGADLLALADGKSLPSGPSANDAKRMKRWLEEERSNAGQLFVGVRDQQGTRRVNKAPVPCWIDTGSGRLLLTPGANGWYTLRSGDTPTVATQLSELEQRLRG